MIGSPMTAAEVAKLRRLADYDRVKKFSVELERQRKLDEARRPPTTSRERKIRLLAIARPLAEVVLDARLMFREGGSREAVHRFRYDERWLVELALVGFRMQHKIRQHGAVVARAWKYANRTRGDRFCDVHCQFCGELLRRNVPPRRDKLFKDCLSSFLSNHTTVCALKCLAGHQPYEPPDCFRLPSEFRNDPDPDLVSFEDLLLRDEGDQR